MKSAFLICQSIVNSRSKRLKYGNKKTNVDGIVFDSAKEASRFRELQALEKSGLISDLQIQQRFEIVPKAGGNKRARFYIADFTYTEGGKKIIEDVKSEITRKNPVYTLKKALILWQYPDFIFRES
jgi:hypothetical protein